MRFMDFINVKICIFLTLLICYKAKQIYSQILIFTLFYDHRINAKINHHENFKFHSVKSILPYY